MCRVLKKGLQVLRGFSTQMSKIITVNICPETSGIHVISTADDVCGPHAFRHNFQLLTAQRCAVHQTFLSSLKSSDRHSLLIDIIPLSY
jgi:hypothetical protein